MSGGTRTLRMPMQHTAQAAARRPMQTLEPVMKPNSLSLAGAAAGSPRQARAPARCRGLALMVIGGLLALVGGYAALQLAPTLLHPGELIGGERFTGSAELGRQLLALLSVLALAGLACAGLGLRQWRAGPSGAGLQANSGSSTAA
jgi:hypothetical protein